MRRFGMQSQVGFLAFVVLCVAFMGYAGAQCVSAPSGLVSWWPGEGNADDVKGTNHGVLRNGATFAEGKVGQSLSFNGRTHFVSIPDHPSLQFSETTSKLTFSAWIKPNQGGVTRSGVIVSKYFVSNDRREWAFGLLDPGRLQVIVFENGANTISTNARSVPVVQWDEWAHVAATVDVGSGVIKFYHNGVEQPLDEIVGVGAITDIPDTSAEIWIGAINSQPGSQGTICTSDTICPGNQFAGLIDELQVFNRVLSASQIHSIFGAGSTGLCPGDNGPTCNGVPATLVGTRNNDRLIGTSGDDVIVGRGGNDVIQGRGGNDLICGDGGNDRIDGGAGDDELRGGKGDDILKGGKDDDVLKGGADNDLLRGGQGVDTLEGGKGDDDLRGDGGNDDLLGQAGNDTLHGGAGDDELRGGAGDDRLQGGSGDDDLRGDGGTKDVCRGGPGRDTARGCEKVSSVP